MQNLNISTKPIHNGWLVTLNGSDEIYFETIEQVQKFFGLWAVESNRLGCTLDELIQLTKQDESV